MDQVNRRIGQRRNVPQRIDINVRIGLRDKLTPSPEIRAGYILNYLEEHLPDLTDWDLLCFCTEYLGSQITVHEFLPKDAVRDLTRIVQVAHYYREEPAETGIEVEADNDESEDSTG